MAILDFDASRNLYAVYTGAQNDAPLVNPLANLPRVKFHGSLPYIGITDQRTVTVNVNPKFFSGFKRQLFLHGKNFRPLVFGTAWINGKPVPTQGGIMIPLGANKILCHVASDTSRVWLKIDEILEPFGVPDTAVNIRFELNVCNVGVSAGGSPILPPFFQGVEATPTRFRCGRFDSNNKHLTRATSGEVSFYRGASISVQQTVNALALRQSVNGYTADLNGPYQPFTASVVRATVK